MKEKILKIIVEKTMTPEITYVKGEYKNKPFAMKYYIGGTYKIEGEFTVKEKVQIVNKWGMNDYIN